MVFYKFNLMTQVFERYLFFREWKKISLLNVIKR